MSHTTLPLVLGSSLAIAAVSAAASYATFVPGNRIWGPVIWRGSKEGPPRMALTFDDGPTAGPTERVLDLLGELNVKAAFFLIGRNVEREPELVRRIVAEGHIVGNHTFDHSRWSSLGRGQFWHEQINKTDAAIERVIGRKPRRFVRRSGIRRRIRWRQHREAGNEVVTWSIRGWDGIPTTAEKIIGHVVPRCRAGSIVVLHDGTEPARPRDPSATIAAIKPIVTALRDKGLEPVRLDELTGLEPYH